MGYNTIDFLVTKDNVDHVVLDYQGMTIISVEEQNQTDNSFFNVTNRCTSYTDQNLGSALSVSLLFSKFFI